jgi:S1-C subfamily serine protease
MSRFWRHFRSNGNAFSRRRHGTRSYLGVHMRTSAHYGVRVVKVEPGSPAAEAGLQRGDVLLALDEQPTSCAADLRELLTRLPVGVATEVTFLRGERRMQRLVVPSEHLSYEK